MTSQGDENVLQVEEKTSAVRTGGSDLSHPLDTGHPAFVFPPPEVKFDEGNMFEWSKMITLTLHGC